MVMKIYVEERSPLDDSEVSQLLIELAKINSGPMTLH